MSDIKISVIIPVYNVEKYIHECIDSVLNQTYKNIEVILVDDGSPDNCGAICDEYAQKDKRIRVIHKENGGLSDARNAGIKIASGQYTVFLDSDDFWTDACGIQKLAERLPITKSDVLNYTYHKFYEKNGLMTGSAFVGDTMPLDINERDKQLDYLTSRSLYIASACNKAVKTELLQTISFKKNMVSEDVEWCARLMRKAKSLDFVNIDFYCYRQRAGSISQEISQKTCNDLKDAIIGCVNVMQENCSDDNEYLGRYTAYQFSTFVAVQAFAEKMPVDCIEQLKKVKWVLKYNSHSKKVRMVYYGVSIFGLKLFCRIIKLTKSLWDRMRKV